MISLSDRAAKELQRIRAEQGLAGGTYVRVSVHGGGCSGFSYKIGFDDAVINESDITFKHEAILLVCDPKSFLYLNEVQIDFEESLMGRGFKFINPNAKNTCGCGESFSV